MTDDVFAGVLYGHQPLDISHEGGEFEAMVDFQRQMSKG
jgi:hypothetical protein